MLFCLKSKLFKQTIFNGNLFRDESAVPLQQYVNSEKIKLTFKKQTSLYYINNLAVL